MILLSYIYIYRFGLTECSSGLNKKEKMNSLLNGKLREGPTTSQKGKKKKKFKTIRVKQHKINYKKSISDAKVKWLTSLIFKYVDFQIDSDWFRLLCSMLQPIEFF